MRIWRDRFYHLSITSIFVVTGFSVGAIGFSLQALAQSNIVPDNTLGNENSQINRETIRGIESDRISGGARRGQNLFHSFERFDIGEGLGAYFDNPEAVRNIFSRVTGSNPSDILGRLGVIQAGSSDVLGDANLFFINPNGILFGPNASLDLGGSFAATTANGMQFGDQGFFSATNPETPSQLLTVNPSALIFSAQSANPGQIFVQGDGQGTRTTTELIDTQSGLRVPDNQTLALVGGNLSLEGATLKTAGGRIELGSIAAPASITLTLTLTGWSLGYVGATNFQDIQLSQQTTVDASGLGGGDIQVQGRRVVLTDGSQIEASTLGSQPGGSIRVNASELVELNGVATNNFLTAIATQVYPGAAGTGGNLFVTTNRFNIVGRAATDASTFSTGNAGNLTIKTEQMLVQNGAYVVSITYGAGNAGDLTIETGQLSVRDRAIISSSTHSQGDAGNLTIRATESVELDASPGIDTALFTQVAGSGEGNAGNLTVETEQLIVRDGAQIGATTFGRGNGGNLVIRASNVELIGSDPRGYDEFPSAIQTRVEPGGIGNAGNLTIITDRLSVQNGARIAADTTGNGDAGNLTIRATESVQIVGISATETLPSLLTASVNQGAVGNAGDLIIETRQLLVRDGGEALALTRGRGNAGNLTIRASDFIELSGEGDLATSVAQGGAGNAGNLAIETRRLSIRDGSRVSANTFGTGNAGNIQVRARDLVEIIGATPLSPSVIRAEVRADAQGNAGSVSVETNQLRIQGGGQISVSTYGNGDAGQLQVNASNILLLGQSEDGANPSGIVALATPGSTGRGGRINLNAENLRLIDGAEISAATSGTGSAGDIIIRDTDRISLDNASITTAINSEAVLSELTMNQGDIDIQTRSLSLTNNANITASTSGQGNAGDVTIRGAETITLDSSSISTAVNRNAIGQGGDIEIRTGLLQLDNQSQISSSTLGRGNTGDILVRATDGITLDDRSQITSRVGRNAVGNSQSITLRTSDLSLNNRSQISAATAGQGNAGDILVQEAQRIDLASGSSISTAVNENAVGQGGTIEIATEVLNLDDRSEISARSQGRGVAGDITITASEQFTATDSDIITASSRSSGGDIRITSSDIRLLGDSDIRTNSGVDGGNITLSANTILAFEDSDILAFAERQGGDITLNTEAFFGDGYQETSDSDTNPAGLDGNERVDINASGQVSSGTITTPDTSFIQNSLTELPDNAIDTDNLVANSCVVRSQTQAGTFVIAGAEGLPQRPGDAPFPTYPTGAVRSTEESSGEPTWQMGDPIVEPEGMYRLADGRMVLSRECP